MSHTTDYNIDLWNAAFNLKTIATKWGMDVRDLYHEMEHIINSDEIV